MHSLHPVSVLRASASLLTALALPAVLGSTAHAAEELYVDQLAAYDQAALQTPESVATDYAGNVYVSLALTGEVSRIDRFGEVSTLATLPIVPLEECFGFVSGLGALTYSPWGLYVNVNSCDPDQRGIWWVSPYTGATERVAALPTDSFANGIARRFGYVYASDSFSGRIFRAPMWGGPAEVWADEPVLEPVPNPVTPIGANGLQFFGNELYVAHSVTGDIVAIEVEPDQSAGPVRIHANVQPGCDDFAFDIDGALYCTTNFANTVVLVQPDGDVQPLLDVSDGLDGPSAATFGRGPRRRTLYVSNASYPFYPNLGDPGVSVVSLDVRGYPFR